MRLKCAASSDSRATRHSDSPPTPRPRGRYSTSSSSGSRCSVQLRAARRRRRLTRGASKGLRADRSQSGRTLDARVYALARGPGRHRRVCHLGAIVSSLPLSQLKHVAASRSTLSQCGHGRTVLAAEQGQRVGSVVAPHRQPAGRRPSNSYVAYGTKPRASLPRAARAGSVSSSRSARSGSKSRATHTLAARLRGMLAREQVGAHRRG